MSRYTNAELVQLADLAFRQAAKTVIRRSRQFGTPIVVWDHQTQSIRHLTPDECERMMQDDSKETNTESERNYSSLPLPPGRVEREPSTEFSQGDRQG